MRTAGRRKITYGFVTQTFDADGKCIEQEFEAGDQVECETDAMEHVDSSEMEDCEYQPFHMVQPSGMVVALVGNLSEGYGAVGPFTSFDEACRWADGQESWALTMQNPYEEFDEVKHLPDKAQMAVIKARLAAVKGKASLPMFAGGPAEWKEFCRIHGLDRRENPNE